MRSGTLAVFLASAVVLATAIGGAYWMSNPQVEVAETSVKSVEPMPMEYQLKTGDSFWGLHLDGVVPCSTMLVRGGGHLVMISQADNPERKCYFQVKNSKVVELGGITFRVTVTDEDQVHVTRELVELASAS